MILKEVTGHRGVATSQRGDGADKGIIKNRAESFGNLLMYISLRLTSRCEPRVTPQSCCDRLLSGGRTEPRSGHFKVGNPQNITTEILNHKCVWKWIIKKGA